MPHRLLLFALLILLSGPALAETADRAGWDALRRDGAVALIHHARAPGIGDPPGFLLTDCATQRRLSPDGEAQARALGRRLRDEGVVVGRVLSSRWCRCLDTARLAFGAAEPFPALDSFFGDRGREPEQTAALRDLIGGWKGPGALILVTHQVNITALTGLVPSEGEILVVRAGADRKIALAARIAAVHP